jgi:hypothetical protein
VPRRTKKSRKVYRTLAQAYRSQADALKQSKSANNQPEGKDEMSETLSLSTFTIEADRKPLLAFAVKSTKRLRRFAQTRGC